MFFFSSLRSSSTKLSFKIAPYCLSKVNSSLNPPAFNLARIVKETCGEDDFLMHLSDESSLFGVADGVGGWTSQGIDPKLFTSALIQSIKSEFSTSFQSPLVDLVQKAYEKMRLERKEIRFGSCTLALLNFDSSTSLLKSYNLGDSGFLVVRDGKIVWKSTEQQHYFNAPFQIGLNDGAPADSPLKGDTSVFSVRSGDVLVVGTDGLFDNLFEEEILKVVAQHSSQKDADSFVQEVARDLAMKAKRIGESQTAASPFAKKALEDGKYFRGGKNDDTTVLVAIFARSEKSEL